jgi:hypothetical protein
MLPFIFFKEGAAMRRHHIWYVLAFVWWGLAALSLLRHRLGPAALEATFATGFFFLGLVIRKRDHALRKRDHAGELDDGRRP